MNIAREQVRRALAESARMNGDYDSLAITRHIIQHTHLVLGDEEAWGESAIIRALDETPLDATEAELVDAILAELGHGAVT